MTLVTGHIAEVSSVTNIHPMFKVGDIVKVDLDIGILKQMQEGHGGWNPRMAEVGDESYFLCYSVEYLFARAVNGFNKLGIYN